MIMTLSRVTTIIGKEKLLLSLTFYYHFIIFKASRVTMEEWNQLLFTIPSHKNAVCFLVQLTAFRIFSRLWLSQFRLVRAHVWTEFSSIFLIVVLEPWCAFPRTCFIFYKLIYKDRRIIFNTYFLCLYFVGIQKF